MSEAPKVKYEQMVEALNARLVGAAGGVKLIDWDYCGEGYGIGVEETYFDAAEITALEWVQDLTPAGYFIEPLNSAVLKMWEL